MRLSAASGAWLLLGLSSTSGAQSAARTSSASYSFPAILGLDEFIPTPDDNPLTAPAVSLGRRLFFDPRLSHDMTLSCASCHLPDRAFSDTLPRSRGVRGRPTRRNAPTIVNRAYGQSLFWDGRVATLEAQVLRPIEDSLEMDLSADSLVARLAGDVAYRTAFESIFGGAITPGKVARALASYVRTIRSGNAPVDRFRNGDAAALSTEARRGMELFLGKANCSSCHVGPNFTDEKFHNTGVALGTQDVGRFAVTGRAPDRRAFKTPTLRNVSRTAPYMHDGSIATLDAVIGFYDRGGRPDPALDPEIRPLRLTSAERQYLVAFLRSLDGSLSNDPGTLRD